MTPEQLFKIIQDIYNTHQFSSKLLIDNLMIISKDNYYQCLYQLEDESNIKFRLEVDYHFSQSFSTYKFVYEFSSKFEQSSPVVINTNENIPQHIIEYILPIIRNFRLKTIIEDENIN